MTTLDNYKEHYIFDKKLGPIIYIKNPKTYAEVAVNGTPLEWQFEKYFYYLDNFVENINIPKKSNSYLDYEIDFEILEKNPISSKPIKIKHKIISQKKQKLKLFYHKKKSISKKINKKRFEKYLSDQQHLFTETCNCLNCTSKSKYYNEIIYNYYHYIYTLYHDYI